MELLVTSITNAASTAIALIAGVLGLWLALMVIYGATLVASHRKK